MSGLKFTPVDQIPKIVASVRDAATQQVLWPEAKRRAQLKALHTLVDVHSKDICDAIAKDLRKPAQEVIFTEVAIVLSEIANAINNLSSWMQTRKVTDVMPHNIFDGCQVRPQPLGMALIIGAFNYPIQLTLGPVVGALAAGTTVVLKPSESAEATAALLADLIPKYMDSNIIKVVNGAVAETTALLAERYDKIFYTGGGVVGKIVLQAASKYLTPCVLELGGKSPAIIDTNNDMRVVARRVAWGKFMNAGQSCVAPDYILCLAGTREKLVKELVTAIEDFYGKSVKQNPDFGRIINERHFNRVKKLIDSGKCVYGGDTDEKEKYIAPTLLVDVDPRSPVMQEEIFGPVLPIVDVNSIDDAIKYVNEHDKPLALYVFSNNTKTCEKVLGSTSSGSAIVNDTMMQVSVAGLPFGGVGASGMGSYHGYTGFECFSHMRAVMFKDQNLEVANAIRYPPFSNTKITWARRLLVEKVHGPVWTATKFAAKAGAAAAVAGVAYKLWPYVAQYANKLLSA